MANNRTEYDYEKKILCIGAYQVGKTEVLREMMADANQSFRDDYFSTIGIDFKVKSVESKGKKIGLRVWDTAGQERFKTVNEAHYKAAQIIVAIFDVTNLATFTKLDAKIKEIKVHAPSESAYIIIGNKCDLSNQRVVSETDAKRFASSIEADYLETSAKTGAGVPELLAKLTALSMPQQNEKEDLLLAKITQFRTAWKIHAGIDKIAQILETLAHSTDRQAYYDAHKDELRAHVTALRWEKSSLFNYVADFVATILSALALPILYCIGVFDANEKRNGDMFRFFAFGAEQAARAIELEVVNDLQLNLCAG